MTNYFTKYLKYKTKYIQATTIDKVVHIGGYSEFEVSTTVRSLRNLDSEYNKYCNDKIRVVEHIRNRKEIELKEAIKSYFMMKTIYDRDTKTQNPRFDFIPTNPDHNITQSIQRPQSRQQPQSLQQPISRPQSLPQPISPQQSQSRPIPRPQLRQRPISQPDIETQPRLEQTTRLPPRLPKQLQMQVARQLQQQPLRQQPLQQSLQQQHKRQPSRSQSPSFQRLTEESLKGRNPVDYLILKYSTHNDEYIDIEKSDINLLKMENIDVEYYIKTDGGYRQIVLNDRTDIDDRLKKSHVYVKYEDLHRQLIGSRDRKLDDSDGSQRSQSETYSSVYTDSSSKQEYGNASVQPRKKLFGETIDGKVQLDDLSRKYKLHYDKNKEPNKEYININISDIKFFYQHKIDIKYYIIISDRYICKKISYYKKSNILKIDGIKYDGRLYVKHAEIQEKLLESRGSQSSQLPLEKEQYQQPPQQQQIQQQLYQQQPPQQQHIRQQSSQQQPSGSKSSQQQQQSRSESPSFTRLTEESLKGRKLDDSDGSQRSQSETYSSVYSDSSSEHGNASVPPRKKIFGETVFGKVQLDDLSIKYKLHYYKNKKPNKEYININISDIKFFYQHKIDIQYYIIISNEYIPVKISYDKNSKILKIDGIRYDGRLFVNHTEIQEKLLESRGSHSSLPS